jgi:hypothetical protein
MGFWVLAMSAAVSLRHVHIFMCCYTISFVRGTVCVELRIYSYIFDEDVTKVSHLVLVQVHKLPKY